MRARLLYFAAALAACWISTARAASFVEIVAENRGNEIELYAQLRNCLHASLELTIDVKNMLSSKTLPLRIELTQPRTFLTTLHRRHRIKAWAYRWHSHTAVGRIGGQPDPAAVYRLPFAPGHEHRVIQGYGGTFSHRVGTPSEYSIDWAMPVGTPVLAARAGRVVALRDDSDEGGLTEDARKKANLIVVEHADGTLADYGHLKFHGVAVALGQSVRAGELIGYSGNTGYSGGPHLHVRISVVRSPGFEQGFPARWDSPVNFGASPAKTQPPIPAKRKKAERISSEHPVDAAK
jgi:murein DD-endopeptidase MepM/ murein hydrolase activator NlpD